MSAADSPVQRETSGTQRDADMTASTVRAAPAHFATARDRLLGDYEAFQGNGAGGAPDWVQAIRGDAIARFRAAGFPTTKLERWRFTNVDGIAKTDFVRASEGVDLDPSVLERYLIGEEGDRLVAATVNGTYVPSSRRPAVPSGVIVTSLAEAVAAHPDLVRPHLARHADMAGNPFAALGTAFVRDGVFVYVPRNVVLDHPVQVVHYTAADGNGAPVAYPRTLVVADQGAQLSVVETYAGSDDAVYWTNAVTEIVTGENAVVDAYRVQRESLGAYHTAITQSYQERNSVFSMNAFAFGSSLSRHDLNAVLDGEGAEATLNGLSLVKGRQHIDHHTTIDHAKPRCNSWELFNGVFDEQARGVFTGRIVVRPGAQKTDSKQTNNNLLLAETARADSQPQLEIYADDVKCTHGATLGPIDPTQLFYLRSRGLNEARALNLLTYGFGAEILNSVSIDELRERLDALVHGRLEGGV